jgi:DNA-binding response OmpR family regulator
MSCLTLRVLCNDHRDMQPGAAPPLVLVAEDEPTMLELLVRHLRTFNQPKLEVIEAPDGDEAWRLAQEQLPDLVVLDVMMPGMSGWDVCRKIREDRARFAHTSVLMLTGIGERVNEMTSPLFGADAYIDKPFDFEELDDKVRGALEKHAAQRAAVPRHVHNGVTAPARPAPAAPRKAKAKAAAAAAPKKAKAKAKPAKTAVVAKGANAAKSSKPAKGMKKSGAKKSAKKDSAKHHKAASKPKGTPKMAAKKAKKVAKKAAKKAAKKTAKKGKKK